MRPRKAKELIPGVAADKNLPVKLVEDIINFYWREVWESLTKAQGIKVHVTNLGDFNIKHWLLDKEISGLKNTIIHNKAKGSQRYITGVHMQEKVDILTNLKEMLHDENQRKEFIYEHKKVVKDDKTIGFTGPVAA